jgi:hypothetical protein
MKLGTFRQTPQEKKRFSISYAAWLDTGEVVASITYAISPETEVPLLIEASALDVGGLGVTFYVSGGEDANEYQINTLMQTDAGQRKEDYIKIILEDYTI